MKKAKETNARVFINLILPYACVLLVPILIWWLSNAFVVQNNEKRMLAMVNSSLENNINVTEASLKQIEDVIYRISQNSGFSKFYEEEDLTFSEVSKLEKDLSSYYIEDGVTEKLYMYSSASGSLISTSSFYPKVEDFLISYHLADLETPEEWKAYFEENLWNNGYAPQIDFSVSRSRYPFITYSRVMPLNSPSQKEGNITALINVQQLLSPFDSILTEGKGEIYVVSSDDKVLMHQGEKYRSALQTEGKQKDSCQTIKADKKKLYYFILKSDQHRWEYHIFMDYDYIVQDMSTVNIVLTGVNILALVLGCLLCVYFTYGRNKSYQRLMQMLGIEKKPVVTTLKTNEFDFWQPYIDNLLDQNRQIKENMDKLSDRSDYKVLHFLLSGSLEDEAAAGRLVADSGLKLKFKHFAVLALRSAAVYNVEGESNKNIFLTHALEEFLGSELYIYIADAKTLAVLIGFNEEEGVFFRRLKNQLVNMNLEVFYRYRMEVLLGVGTAADQFCDIARAYAEARQVVSYNHMTGTKEKLFFDELPSDQTMYYYPLEVENGLVSAISSGKAGDASKILDTIYEENFTKRSLSCLRTEELMNEIYSSLNKVRQTYFKDEERVDYRLSDFTIKSFFEYARDFVFAACENMKVFDENAHNSQFKNMLEYIQENYTSNELSRDTLAAAFGLTDSTYISKMFKKFMDENFSSYLERIRMEKACELLDRRMPVKDVAAAVGYLSDISFRRVFRKRLGMSPSEYINQHKKN
ncbi:MAG: AraC family transcriptional regulator [Clostridia bacterium]|nr:AraC family transcriptional regulator [Clostridia bacterium]